MAKPPTKPPLRAFYVRVSRDKPGHFAVVRAWDVCEVFHSTDVDRAFKKRRELAKDLEPKPDPKPHHD